MTLSLEQFVQIKKHDFTKEFKDFEYETKFDIKDGKLGSLKVLNKIRSCFKNSQHFVLCEIKGGDKLLTHVLFFLEATPNIRFLSIGAQEWSRLRNTE